MMIWWNCGSSFEPRMAQSRRKYRKSAAVSRWDSLTFTCSILACACMRVCLCMCDMVYAHFCSLWFTMLVWLASVYRGKERRGKDEQKKRFLFCFCWPFGVSFLNWTRGSPCFSMANNAKAPLFSVGVYCRCCHDSLLSASSSLACDDADECIGRQAQAWRHSCMACMAIATFFSYSLYYFPLRSPAFLCWIHHGTIFALKTHKKRSSPSQGRESWFCSHHRSLPSRPLDMLWQIGKRKFFVFCTFVRSCKNEKKNN